MKVTTVLHGHEKGHENAEPFVWLGQCDITEHIIVDRDEQSKVAADKKLYNCKKQYRNKAGNLSDVRWKRIGVYENESEGKLAAGDLCRPCGHRWVNMRRNKQGNTSMTFVCAWEKCQFVMRLVEQSDNKYELCVVEDRQHVHDIVSDGKVPTAITLYVQKKWKEYCLLAPSAVKHLMTTAHVNNDISVDDRHKFERAFRDKKVSEKFTRWFWNEKQKHSSLENEAKSKELEGLDVADGWNDMFRSKWTPTQGTLGVLHTHVTYFDYNTVRQRKDFGPHSVYYIAYKFKRVCKYD